MTTRLRGRRKVPWSGVLPVPGTNAPYAALKPRRGKPGVELTIRLGDDAPDAERGRRVVVGLLPWAARALRDRLTELLEEESVAYNPFLAQPYAPTRRYRKVPVVVFARGPLVADELVHTLEGDLMARVGDYIVTADTGESWPVKGDIFMNTYEEVE